MSWEAGRAKIRERLYRLPVIRGIFYQLEELRGQYRDLQRKYDALFLQYHALMEKDRGLDWRIDDAYHEIFLNKMELWQRCYEQIPEDRYPQALTAWYFRETGKKLDLAHPKTFNEKIQWIKLYGLDETCTVLADKYAVRAHIEKVLGKEYLIPLLGVWDTFDEIDFDRLPDRFVLKANHGSGMNAVVRDKAAFDKTAARKQFQRWMSVNYAFYMGFELQYAAIPRKIIAETYMEDEDGKLREYKFLCFQGEVIYIAYYESCAGVKRMAYYDPDWNRLPFQMKGFLRAEDTQKPEKLDVMMQFSRQLGRDFYVLRADWYLLQSGGIKFGELTFTPGSGVAEREPEFDRMTGSRLHIPAG